MSHAQTLQDEIVIDPLQFGYVALVNEQPGRVCDLLNAPTRTRTGTVPVSVFAIWAGQTGMRGAIEDAASDKASPLRSIALTLLDLLRGGVSDALDLGHAGNQTMLSAWQQAGAITQAQRDALLALASQPCSRADELGLPRVTESDLRAALED